MNEQTVPRHIFKPKRGSEVWKQFHWEVQPWQRNAFISAQISLQLKKTKNKKNKH